LGGEREREREREIEDLLCTVVVLSFCPPVDVAGRCKAERSGDGAETETRRRQDGDEEQRRAFGLPSLLLKLEIL